MAEKSVGMLKHDLASAIHQGPAGCHKKLADPGTEKPKETEDVKDQELAELNVQGTNECTNLIPCTGNVISLPAGFINPSISSAEDPSIHRPSQKQISAPQALVNGEQADVNPVPPKKKRGRPRKDATKVSNKTLPSNETDLFDGSKESFPLRRLRSRREQPPSSDGKTCTPTALHTENPSESIHQGFKRRPKSTVKQILAKVFKPGTRRGISPVVSNDTSTEERAEVKEMGELRTVEFEADVCKEKEQSITHFEEELQQTAAEQQVAPVEEQLSNKAYIEACVEPQAEQLVNSNVGNPSKLLIEIEPLSFKGSSTYNVKTSEENDESSRTPGVLPKVKDEDFEIELDNFTSNADSNRHTSLQHQESTAVKSEYPNWNYPTERQNELTNPMDEQQKDDKKCDDERENNSSVKPRKRRSLYGYRRNKQRKRGFLPGEAIAQPKEDHRVNSNDIPTRGKEKVLLKCKDCGRLFKFLSQYIIHRRIHTGEKPYKCNECGKAFSKNSNLNLHLKTHRKYALYQKCYFCKIKLPNSEYSSHMKMHSETLKQESESMCDKPGNDGDDDWDEVSHEPKYTKLICQYCGKQFPFQSALIRHVRVHTGEKPYKCDICGKGFGQAYFLRVHELTHWSVKRYNCTLCGKSFAHYSNAKNHPCSYLKENKGMLPRRRSKPSLSFTCHICKSIFYQLQDFNNHMRAHSGTKLYRCLFCDKLFGVLSEFSAHYNQCSKGKGDLSSLTPEEIHKRFEFSLPQNMRRGSLGQILLSPAIASSTQTKKVANIKGQESLQTLSKKPSKKPFEMTSISHLHLSFFVSTLNKLDNRSDPRKYFCPNCGRLFRHMGRLRAHVLTHGHNQSYTCSCCGKTLQNWLKLWHHQRIHRQRQGRFTCPQCGQGFRFLGSYKRHMTEHPQYQWIQGRPNKVSLPYQCEECRASFKTLDLLFSHQLCHSSSQDLNKDSDYHLLLDDQGAHSKRNSAEANFPTESPQNHNYTPAPHQVDPLSDTLLSQPALDPSLPRQVILDSLTLNMEVDETVPQPSGTPVCHEKEVPTVKHVGIEGGTFIDEKRPIVSSNVKLKEIEGSCEGLKCAVCGSAHAAISDLYQHYLQHARGQL